MVDAMYRVCAEARYIPSTCIVFDKMYRAWQGMYRDWNVWGGTSFVNPGLAAIGVHASNTLVTAGPSVAGLGHVLTLLTGMYVIVGIHHAVHSKSLVSGVILGN
jgi:hypothetical protein